MKLIIAVGLLLTVLSFIAGAAAQSSNTTARDLMRLKDNRNTQVVGTCTQVAASLLTCSLLGNDLAISDQVHVTSIRFFIQLCDSSLLVNLTLSNETMLNVADLAQCNTQVTLEQLMLAIDIAVFINSQNNTVINTSVTFNAGAGNVALFDETPLLLSEQDQVTVCAEIGVTPPPASCNSSTTMMPETSTMTPVSTTTMKANTSSSESMPITALGTTFYGHVLLISVASTLTLLHGIRV